MARTSAIISLVVVFVLAVLINNEVQGSCMSECNKQCKTSKNDNGVSCGAACFVQCLHSGNNKNQLSPEEASKLAHLKQTANGSVKKEDVEKQLREIALHMMQISESQVHHHKHKYGEKPHQAPKHTLKEDDLDITDDDETPDVKSH